jgi:hypothetical protein
VVVVVVVVVGIAKELKWMVLGKENRRRPKPKIPFAGRPTCY